MTSVSSSSTALQLLQQSNGTWATTTSGPTQSVSDTITSLANAKAGTVNVTKQPSQAESKVAQSMFSVNNVNITKQKLDLIDRTGKALGVNQDDYASRDDFVEALQKAFGHLKITGGDGAVQALEKELGLDKLGVSLQDVIDSARDPDANDNLTKALKRQAGIYGDDADGNNSTPSLPTQTNEIGLYGSANQ